MLSNERIQRDQICRPRPLLWTNILHFSLCVASSSPVNIKQISSTFPYVWPSPLLWTYLLHFSVLFPMCGIHHSYKWICWLDSMDLWFDQNGESKITMEVNNMKWSGKIQMGKWGNWVRSQNFASLKFPRIFQVCHQI